MRQSARIPGPSATAGFTIVEFVVAASVMFIAVVGVMGVIGFATMSTGSAEARSRALNIANQRIEQLRNLPYDSVGTYDPGGAYGDPPGSILTPQTISGHVVKTEVTWVRDTSSGRAEYKRVKVTVSWTKPNAGKVEASTIVYGKSNLVNTGDVLVRILDLANGQPLSACTVALTPQASTTRTVFSDAAGEAFFGFAPAGPAAMTISRTGYLFDPAAFASPSITADLLTTIVVYGQRASRARVHVEGSGDAPIAGAAVMVTDSTGTSRTGVTDAEGVATFENLLIGTYTVQASATGRPPAMTTFDITAGDQTAEPTLTLADPSGLIVHVNDGNGVAMSGAQVRVTGPSPGTNDVSGSPASTLSNGEVSFAGLAVGTYTIGVSKSGFVDYTGTATLAAGQDVVHTVGLAPVSFGSLTIRTKNKSGDYASGIRVKVWNNAIGYYRDNLYSDGNSRVQLNNLLPGVYTVQAYKSGSAQVPANVSSGQNSTVVVQSR